MAEKLLDFEVRDRKTEKRKPKEEGRIKAANIIAGSNARAGANAPEFDKEEEDYSRQYYSNRPGYEGNMTANTKKVVKAVRKSKNYAHGGMVECGRQERGWGKARKR